MIIIKSIGGSSGSRTRELKHKLAAPYICHMMTKQKWENHNTPTWESFLLMCVGDIKQSLVCSSFKNHSGKMLLDATILGVEMFLHKVSFLFFMRSFSAHCPVRSWFLLLRCLSFINLPVHFWRRPWRIWPTWWKAHFLSLLSAHRKLKLQVFV